LDITALTQGFYPWTTSKGSLPKQQMKWDWGDEATCRLTPVLVLSSLVLGQAGDPQALQSSPFPVKQKPWDGSSNLSISRVVFTTAQGPSTGHWL